MDGGVTWISHSNTLIRGLRSVVFTDPNTGIAVGGQGAYRTVDGGVHWNLQYLVPARIQKVFFSDFLNGTAVGLAAPLSASTILRTTDGGVTWKEQLVSGGTNLNGVFFTDARNAWAVGDYGTILRTTTAGEPNLSPGQ
jgi:photosystem II stability/assembly factor-like uncharacterized protein